MRTLQTLPVPSTYVDRVTFNDDDGSARLRFTYERGDLEEVGEFAFDWVRAYRHRAESHCTEWHIDAYDRLVEVEDSEWVAELLDAMPEDMRGLFVMRHFMIYMDSVGCYEVIARSWAFLPETSVGGPS
jgi:hypothetical protein